MESSENRNVTKYEVPLRGKILSITQIIKELLNVVDSCLDYSKVDVQSVLRLTGCKEVQANSPFSGILTKLNTRCGMCEAQRSFTNSCGHGYCKKCASDVIEKKIGCEKCGQLISEQFIIDVLKLNSFKKTNAVCKRCNSTKAYINRNTGCGHLCKMCIIEIIDECEDSCFVCGYELLQMDEIFARKKICVGCETKRFCIGDRLSKVCSCRKRLCLNCMECMLRDKKCASCMKNLTQKEVVEVYRKCCGTCALCSQNYSYSFLIRKLCCKIKICLKCDESGRQHCFNGRQKSMIYHK